MKFRHLLAAALSLVTAVLGTAPAQAQTAFPKLEYVMTYKALLEPPMLIDSSLLIVNVVPGGWIKGPNINGSFVSPGADWLRVMPSGVLKLDVRAVMKTDDGELLYITYNGLLQHTEESFRKMNAGEVVKASDVAYFSTAPTIQTGSKKYDYLNRLQLINKFVELQFSPNGSYIIYDVFAVK